jgi:aryl-alcohol dehydrogenase-like predicted oxidoreductase
MSVKSIPLRKLGKDGPSVPALGFGLVVLAGAYGAPPSDDERFAILDRALELGDTFWDSSK